jgi:hypothetical protein
MDKKTGKAKSKHQDNKNNALHSRGQIRLHHPQSSTLQTHKLIKAKSGLKELKHTTQ